MSAAKLIQIASAKGYRIGRERRGVYYYGKGENLWSIECDWNHFVKFVQNLPVE